VADKLSGKRRSWNMSRIRSRVHESGNGGAKDSLGAWLQISTPSTRSRWQTGYSFAEISHRRFCSWMFLASAHGLHRLFEAENEPELLAAETVKESATRQEKSSHVT